MEMRTEKAREQNSAVVTPEMRLLSALRHNAAVPHPTGHRDAQHDVG